MGQKLECHGMTIYAGVVSIPTILAVKTCENHGVDPRQTNVSGDETAESCDSHCQAKEQMEREREKARLKRAERDSATKVQLCSTRSTASSIYTNMCIYIYIYNYIHICICIYKFIYVYTNRYF